MTRRQVVIGAGLLGAVPLGALAVGGRSDEVASWSASDWEVGARGTGSFVELHGDARVRAYDGFGGALGDIESGRTVDLAMRPGEVTLLDISSNSEVVCTFRDMDCDFECEPRRLLPAGEHSEWVTWVPGVNKHVDVWAGNEPVFDKSGVA